MNGQSSYRVTSPMTPSPSSVVPSPSLFNRDMFQFRSLPRRSRLVSLPGSPVVPDISLDCECPYNNRTNGMNGGTRVTGGVLRSHSVTVRPETSLNEVVERFEQVLRDQGRFEHVLRDQGRFENVLRDQGRFENVLRDQGKLPSVSSRMNSKATDFETCQMNHSSPFSSKATDFETCQMNHSSPLFLPKKSPSFGLSSFPRNGRVVESEDSRYKAFALMRQRTVPVNGRFQEEDRVTGMAPKDVEKVAGMAPKDMEKVAGMAPKDVPDKLKESSLIVKRNSSWGGSGRSDPMHLSLETSPTDEADDVFGSFLGSSSSPATTRSTSADSAVIGSKELTYESVEGVTIDPIPENSSSSITSVRSVGISTNFAPSFNRKTPPKIILKNESITRSTSTQKISTSDFMCQAVPDRHSRGTDCLVPVAITPSKSEGTTSSKSERITSSKSEGITPSRSEGTTPSKSERITPSKSERITSSRSVGISVNPDPGCNESTQTYRVFSYDAGVQVSEKCSTCCVKQTETIGTGESNIHTTDIAVGPDDDMFERIRKERQRQREADSIFVAKPAFVTDTRSSEDTPSPAPSSPTGMNPKETDPKETNPTGMSPTGMSRIPRLQQSYSGSSDGQIVIEETCNEILVYRRPNDSMVESPPGKHRAFLPQMISEESQHLISACKIEDEEAQGGEEAEKDEVEAEEEGMSESSDDDESVVVREVLMRPPTKRTEPSKEMKEALRLVNDQLQKSSSQLDAVLDTKLANARGIIEGEWFKVSSSKSSDPFVIEDFLDYFETLSSHLLNHIVNMTDSNGNTAMHYAISYSNFDAASVLLDSKVCDVNKLNKAGYSSLMLVSLSKIMNETQKAVVKRLFQLGDVNLRAKQNGQTALMLAASHGQRMTVKLLLECGAAVNLQDSDGSTALMCASEHNHVDVVKLLVAHPETDPNVSDNEGSTALSIAMAAGHKDIGLVIYAATNMLRGSSAYSSLRRPAQPVPSTLRRTASFNSSRV